MRPVFLTGLMGTGKSTVGQAVAARAGVPFVDLDARIESRAGATVASLFATRGESGFRSLEREALEVELADATPRVVALGGGALLDRTTRLRALEAATVVALVAPAEALAARLARDTSRPLLADAGSIGALAARLRELGQARAVAYAEVHASVDTAALGVEAAAARVLDVATRDLVAVPLGERTYTVELVGPGTVGERLGAALADLAPTRVVHVTDEVVAPLLDAAVGPALAQADPALVRVVLPTGEAHKTLASVERILEAAVFAPIDRRAVVVAVGGGVLSDVAGLAAALALRGVRWVAVPTTLLAMVDASVGGKTAVDLGAAKNAVGAFHQPSRVLIDPSLTRTETDRAFRSGLAEVVKSALIGDAALFASLCAEGGAERLRDRDVDAVARAVGSSVRVKAGVVGRDEREAGERAHLNLGHTIGHALEAHGGFARLLHGEGVALGLVAAARVGRSLGLTPAALEADLVRVLERLGLPTRLDAEPLAAALPLVGLDKKRDGAEVGFVVVREPGRVERVKLPLATLARHLGVG